MMFRAAIIATTAALAVHFPPAYGAPEKAGNDNKKTHSTKVKYEEDGENFFSKPGGNSSALPRYRTEKKPSEKIRAFIQAGTPELEQLKMIGSLKGKERQDVLKSYEIGRSQLQPLSEEFNQLRKRMSPALIEKMLSNENIQMETNMQSKDFELLLKARSAIQKLRSKRLSNWEEIQAKLTSAQIEELEKLKSGEIPPDYLPDETKTAPQKAN